MQLRQRGANVSDTDNHLFLMNVLDSFGINGKQAQQRLEEIGITTNKNMIHVDTLSPALTSGVRIGFAAVTSRGCSRADAVAIADIIYDALSDLGADLAKLKARAAGIATSWKDVTELDY